MSYVTVEVEIDHGRVVPCEPERLPERGNGLLTILPPAGSASRELRPFGLAKGQFVVPADFNTALPEAVLRDFEGA